MQALRDLVDAGAEIKGIRHLHAKAYLFDDDLAMVTSANLTARRIDAKPRARVRGKRGGDGGRNASVISMGCGSAQVPC